MADHLHQELEVPGTTSENPITDTTYALRQVEKPNAVSASNELFDRTEAEMELARIDGRIQRLVYALWNSANPPAPKNTSPTTVKSQKPAQDYTAERIQLLQEQIATARSQLENLNSEKTRTSGTPSLKLDGRIKHKIQQIRHFEKELLKLENPEAAHTLAVQRLTKRIARAEERHIKFKEDPNFQQEAENEERNLRTMRQELKTLTDSSETNKTSEKRPRIKLEPKQEREKLETDYRKQKRIQRTAKKTTQPGKLPTAPDFVTKVINEVDRLIRRREDLAQQVEAAKIPDMPMTPPPPVLAQEIETPIQASPVPTIEVKSAQIVPAAAKPTDKKPAARKPRKKFVTVPPEALAETMNIELPVILSDEEHAAKLEDKKRFPLSDFRNAKFPIRKLDGRTPDVQLTEEDQDRWDRYIAERREEIYNPAREKHHAR